MEYIWQVIDHIPSLINQYLPALLSASKLLSQHFNEDPSAWGVSNAIMAAEAALELAFVAWCGVVGEFFGGKRESPPPTRRPGIRDVPISALVAKEEFVSTTITKTTIATTVIHEHRSGGDASKARAVSMHGLPEAYVASASSATTMTASKSSSAWNASTHWLFRPAFASGPLEAIEEKSGSSSRQKSLKHTGRNHSSGGDKRRTPPFRELAILPTQRVTRYVLLYKGDITFIWLECSEANAAYG